MNNFNYDDELDVLLCDYLEDSDLGDIQKEAAVEHILRIEGEIPGSVVTANASDDEGASIHIYHELRPDELVATIDLLTAEMSVHASSEFQTKDIIQLRGIASDWFDAIIEKF